jgi:hypothetical protein
MSTPDLTILALPPSVPTERVRSIPVATEKIVANGSALGEGKDANKGDAMEEDDDIEEKSLRTGLKTNPVYKTIGELMGKEGEDVLAVCVSAEELFCDAVWVD